MAFSISNAYRQVGNKFVVWGTAQSDSSAADASTILDFSSLVDDQPFGENGPKYTVTRVERAIITHGSLDPVSLATAKGYFRVRFAADVAVVAFGIPFGYLTPLITPEIHQTHHLDFTKSTNGGLVDPKAPITSSQRGDLTISRTIQQAGATNDLFSYTVSGTLQE